MHALASEVHLYIGMCKSNHNAVCLPSDVHSQVPLDAIGCKMFQTLGFWRTPILVTESSHVLLPQAGSYQPWMMAAWPSEILGMMSFLTLAILVERGLQSHPKFTLDQRVGIVRCTDKRITLALNLKLSKSCLGQYDVIVRNTCGTRHHLSYGYYFDP